MTLPISFILCMKKPISIYEKVIRYTWKTWFETAKNKFVNNVGDKHAPISYCNDNYNSQQRQYMSDLIPVILFQVKSWRLTLLVLTFWRQSTRHITTLDISTVCTISSDIMFEGKCFVIFWSTANVIWQFEVGREMQYDDLVKKRHITLPHNKVDLQEAPE